MVCLSVCLSHSCALLRPFDGFRCHLAGTLVGSNDTLREMGSLIFQGKGRLGESNPQPKHAIANCSQTVSPMLPPGEYKRGVGWTCHSDSALCQITLWSLLLLSKLLPQDAPKPPPLRNAHWLATAMLSVYTSTELSIIHCCSNSYSFL